MPGSTADFVSRTQQLSEKVVPGSTARVSHRRTQRPTYGLVELDRAVRLSPTASATDLVHKVKLEPLLRNVDYTVVRYGLWRKLSLKASKRGIEFLTPITLTDSRYLYEITRSLNDLCIQSMNIESFRDLSSTTRHFHSLRTFFKRRPEVISSDCVAQSLKVIALNLRLAKSTLRVAGHADFHQPDFVGSQDVHLMDRSAHILRGMGLRL